MRESIGVASGTDALTLSFKALGISAGDEVLVPANTFIATAIGLYDLGAIPVPVDIDPVFYLMDMEDAEGRVNSRTRAIVPVHLYGQSMDMDSVMDFAKKHSLKVVEDACQAHGAKWNDKRVGGFGDTGCFSFFPGKNMGAFGDGGLVATNDPQLSQRIKLLRNYGSTQKYVHDLPGTNSRLDSIHAAILDVKLKMIDDWNRKRFKAACKYVEGLRGIASVKSPVFDSGNPSRHVFHLFVIQCDQRDRMLGHLNENGVSMWGALPSSDSFA